VGVSIRDVEVHTNRAMVPSYAQLDLDGARRSMPGPLREVVALGVAILGDRVYLRTYWERRATAAQRMDRRAAERWVNAVTWPGEATADEPALPPALLGWGIVTALALFSDAGERGCRLALQADLRLTAPPDRAGPGSGCATIALHLHSVQGADDDLSAESDRRADPAMTLTLRPYPPGRRCQRTRR
jgi:hypothetical protein